MDTNKQNEIRDFITAWNKKFKLRTVVTDIC